MRTISAFEFGVLLARNSAGMQKLAQNSADPPVQKPPQPQFYYNPTGRNLSGPQLTQMYQNLDAQSPQWLQSMVKTHPIYKNVSNVRFEPAPYPNKPIPQGQKYYRSASGLPVNPYYRIIGDRDGEPYQIGEVRAPNIHMHANLNSSNVQSIIQNSAKNATGRYVNDFNQ